MYFIRVILCVVCLGLFVGLYINVCNKVTELQLMIPALNSDLALLKNENSHLQFLVDKIDSPENLIEFTAFSEYNYLKYPLQSEIVDLSDVVE